METTYKLQDYEGDVMIVGPGMTAERYREIKAGLPAETRARVIGWRRTGR